MREKTRMPKPTIRVINCGGDGEGEGCEQGRREGLRTHCSFGKLESGIRTAEFWCWLQAAQ
jgi:hypothetical protein